MAQIGSTLTAETGDTSEFTSVTAAGSNTFTASTDHVYAGTYSFKALFDGTNVNTYGEETFTEGTERWLTARVFVDSSVAFSSTFRSIKFLGLLDGTVSIVEMGANRGSGGAVERWACYDRTNNSYSSTNFSLDKWHFVKMQFVQGNGTGIARVWVDGSLIHEYTNLVYPSYLIDRIRIGGFAGTAPAANSAIYIEDISIFDSDPGSETSSPVGSILHSKTLRSLTLGRVI